MTDITHIFGGEFKAVEHVDPVEDQLADAMRSAGLEPPADIKIDGQLHRFSTKGRKKDDSGWYVIFSDGVPAGRFGCWREGIEVKFIANVGRELSAAERMSHTKRMAEAQAARDAAREKRNEVAADVAADIWAGAAAASPDHPYLKAKGVQPHGARITGDGRLVIPLYDSEGSLASLQYISTNGDKIYHSGAKVGGMFWRIGDGDGDVFIAEGFATAATVHEVTGETVYIAYSASNLPKVAEIVRAKDKMQPIIIVADNDTGGVGKNYADQAAAKTGARIVMPTETGQDANDYHQAGNDLNHLLYPPRVEWLIHADEFSNVPSPLSWHIKHWLPKHSLIMVHGPSGGGKTFVVLDMMCHIAAAVSEWFGHKVNTGCVIYLAGEGHYGMRGRIAAWKQANGIKSLDMFISRSGLDLNTPEGFAKVCEQLRALPYPPSIIVVDTLHRFLNGDENSAQDAKTMLDACAALMDEFGCSVLLVHHTGVSDEAQHRARGSSAWRGALDVEISITPPKKAGSISIIQRKQKDTELQPAIFVDLDTVQLDGWMDEDGEQVTSAVISEGVTPPQPIDKVLIGHQKTFADAWQSGGSEVDQDDNPYLTRSKFKDFLVDIGQEKNATKYSNPNNKANGVAAGPAAILKERGKIVEHSYGYSVVDQDWANALRIQKKTLPD